MPYPEVSGEGLGECWGIKRDGAGWRLRRYCGCTVLALTAKVAGDGVL